MADASGSKLARASTEIVDPTTTDKGCFVGMLVFMGLLCLVPFAGVVAALLGYIWAKGSQNERHEALTHRIDAAPVVVDDVQAGDVVTLCGRVVSSETVITPLKNDAVLAELWMDDEVAESVQDPEPTWTQQLGGDLLLRTETGDQIAIEGAWSLLSDRSQTTMQHDGVPPAHAPLTAEERTSLKEGCSQYGERWLRTDVEVLVTGRVEAVTRVETAGAAGYRGLDEARRVVVGPPSSDVVRISTYAPAQIAAMAREAQAMIGAGRLGIAFGLFSCYAWWRFFFG